MTLHNYWWLLIWVFLVGGMISLFVPKHKENVLGQEVMRWGWISAAVLVAPYVIWAGWRSNAWGDTGVYRAIFMDIPTEISGIASYVAANPKGYLFAAFSYLFKHFISSSSVAFFFSIAFVQAFFLVRIYRKFSYNFWLSIFLFVASTDYLSWMHNGMRQFLAVTLIFTCIPLLIKRNYFLMCVVVLVAALIHTVSLIFLPFIFVVNGRAWNKRTILYILALILAILFLNRVSDFIVRAMQESVYQGDVEIYLTDDGTNIIRVLFYAVPTIMAWVFRSYIDRADDPMINMCVNFSIISTGIYIFSYFTSGVLVGAMPIYFSLTNYILIPWIISEVFEKRSGAVVNAIFIVVYSAFFYYQCGPIWGLI